MAGSTFHLLPPSTEDPPLECDCPDDLEPWPEGAHCSAPRSSAAGNQETQNAVTGGRHQVRSEEEHTVEEPSGGYLDLLKDFGVTNGGL